ncbi:hypothetical protein [Hymenobacter fodinae]|uniref:Uncharacterized protein n=1 Tax=Hymenobacter fodinae TaxID=2510796 RepID=A0A4Z0PAL1_9BACT|nr:hypothetical protein [Hymenobacter fodinae]TGE08496.1 hypothetical protein EU556_12375 [Hymenobacter fodinae]
MQNTPDVIEATIQYAQWEEVVRFFTHLYGEPRVQSDSEVVFVSADTSSELRLTRAEEKELTEANEPIYRPVKGSNGEKEVKDLYDKAISQGAYSVQKPKKIGPSNKVDTTIAIVGIGKSRNFLDDQLFCFIHNPNW